MDLFDKFKSFLGINRQEDQESFQRYHPPYERPPHDVPERNFNILTDPLEMHRYFEQEINEMLKRFWGPESRNGFFFGNVPGLEFHDSDRSTTTNPRDEYLKPGYENMTGKDKPIEKMDTDIDGKANLKDLDELFRNEREVVPYNKQPNVQFFGQSFSTKTIMKPDGTVEIYKTVRDNEGNEETTITKKQGDREYVMKKRRDKNGKEEIVEDLMNIDDKDLPKFLGPDSNQPPNNNPHSWINDFFK